MPCTNHFFPMDFVKNQGDILIFYFMQMEVAIISHFTFDVLNCRSGVPSRFVEILDFTTQLCGDYGIPGYKPLY